VTAAPDNLTPCDLARRRRSEMRGVIRMTVPMVVTICSRLVMDLADFKMVSYLGPNAQGALLPAQITLWTVTVLGFVTVTMVNTFVSQSLGRDRKSDTGAYAWQGVYLSLVFGAACLALIPALPAVFAWIGHSPGIQKLEVEYAWIGVLTIAPTAAGEALASFFNGVHKPRVSMWSAIEANLINIGVSMMLIFGLLGFPAMGVAGAAWGTLVGVTYRLFRLLWVFTSGQYGLTYGGRWRWRPDLTKAKAIIRVGSPQGFQAFSDVIVWAIFVNILIGRTFGDADLIGTNVAWQYLRISFMPAFGLGIAVTSLVGKAVGQRDHAQAMRLTRIAAGLLCVYMLTLSIVYLLFRRELIGWWTSDADVIRVGAMIMFCTVIFQFFDGLGIVYQSALKGAGDTFWPAMVTSICHWTFTVGGGGLMITLKPELGSLGPWSAATFLLTFLGLVLWWRWRSGAWQRVDIFKHERIESNCAVCGYDLTGNAAGACPGCGVPIEGMNNTAKSPAPRPVVTGEPEPV